MCPSSPAKPREPRYSSPSMTMPAPTPTWPGDVDERLQVARDAVPQLGQRRQVRLVADRRRRRWAGPRRASISAPIAICVQPRLGARSSVRSPTSTRPGTATPTPITRRSSVWARAKASRASAARSSSTFSGGSSPSMRVRRASKRTAPVRSSMPAVRPSTAISRPSATVVPVMTIGVAGRPTAGTRPASAPSRTRPSSSSSATRLETVLLLRPVSAATRAREIGPAVAMWRSTTPRLPWRTTVGSTRDVSGAVPRTRAAEFGRAANDLVCGGRRVHRVSQELARSSRHRSRRPKTN